MPFLQHLVRAQMVVQPFWNSSSIATSTPPCNHPSSATSTPSSNLDETGGVSEGCVILEKKPWARLLYDIS